MRLINRIQTMKFSIRVSIISLFILLLSIVGFTIIGISYFTINKILFSSAKNLIEQSSLQLKDRIHLYLMPLNRDLTEIQGMLNTGILNPEDLNFSLFLKEALVANSHISMLYFAKTNGDFYAVGREGKEIHIYRIQHKSKQRFLLNAVGKLVKAGSLDINFDPRTRPWYQKVMQTQKPSLTAIYTFINFENTKASPNQGISAAVPVFSRNKKLIGVFGMDLSITHIQQFLNNLNLTKNSLAYIRDKDKNIIAYKNEGKEISGNLKKNYYIPISDIEKSKSGTVFSFKYKGEEFFLVHQAIQGFHPNAGWYVTIIVPAKDILSPLSKVSFHAFILTLIVLLIGALLVHYISQKISNPIIFVAKEAKEITQLNLKLRPLINTRIKEISYLDESLINMCLSLLSFQRYVPSSLVKNLVKSGKIAQVGGESQRITVLFSDIKSFTTLAESSTPKELMRYLSDYFQSMTESVIKHQGTVDKYIGDAIMALWNAPFEDKDHCLHACQSAVDMLKRVKELNSKNLELGIPAFTIRIGVETGEAIVGNVGSEDRLSFTALGDTVNLANRIEELNKLYETNIIVGNDTYIEIAEHFPSRLLDEVAVRGKHRSIKIYELITADEIYDLERHKDAFLKAFALYQKGEFTKSLSLFESLIPAYLHDKLAEVYIKRCHALLEFPRPNWDGIWRS